MDSALKSIQLSGKQLTQSFKEAASIKLPNNYRQFNNLISCGMGGSQLAADLVKYLFGNRLNLPLIQVRNYQLPKFVNQRSLVFLLSYSGTTEEIISCAKEVIKNKLKAIVIASGGELIKLAKLNQLPYYQFSTDFNPSGQPRLGTGYLLGSILSILNKLKVIKLNSLAINQLINGCEKAYQQYVNSGQLKKLSNQLATKVPIIIGSEFLLGNAHLLANQLNESAKQMAIYYPLPELNHHLLEGLTFPKELKKKWHFIFLKSQLYHQNNQKRYLVTKKVLAKQGIGYSELKFTGNQLNQAMALMVFGSLLAYQLAKQNKVDPLAIPWVEYFKKQLAK